MADRYSDAEIVSTFSHSTLDRDVLLEFSGLKLIATRSTGFDHIDLEPCIEKGAAVADLPTYGDHAVPEHGFALLLPSYLTRTHQGGALPADRILLRMRNMIIRPHSAFKTREAMQRVLSTTRENSEGFIRGEPRNLVPASGTDHGSRP